MSLSSRNFLNRPARIVCGLVLSVLACLEVCAAPLLQATPNRVSVLTALPVTHYLATSLAKDTAIAAHFVGPDTGGLDDQARFLKDSNDFALLARDADAVITVRGAWPEDPLFPAARAVNIRVVEIDAATPVEAGRVGVGLVRDPGNGDDGNAPFVREVWTSPSNVAKMASVAAADFARLSPADAETIQRNLAGVKARLFTLRTDTQRALMTVKIPEVVSLAAPFLYLCQDLGIHVDAWFLTDPFRWDDAARDSFLDAAGRVPVVISAFPLEDALAASLKDRHVAVAVLDPQTLHGDMPEEFEETLRQNIAILLEALNHE